MDRKVGWEVGQSLSLGDPCSPGEEPLELVRKQPSGVNRGRRAFPDSAVGRGASGSARLSSSPGGWIELKLSVKGMFAVCCCSLLTLASSSVYKPRLVFPAQLIRPKTSGVRAGEGICSAPSPNTQQPWARVGQSS